MRVRMTLRVACIIVAFCGVLSALLAYTEHEFTDRWDRTHRYPAAASSPPIDLSLLAGEYLKEHKYGAERLSILADGRYSYFSHACTGVGGRESGHIRRAAACYVLSPTKESDEKLERVLLAIPWGNREYLISPQRMQEFCDAIIDGHEPRNAGTGWFYLRDPCAGISGIPNLPEPWAGNLRQRIVVAKMLAVVQPQQVRIDAGRDKGITLDTVFAVQGRDEFDPLRLVVTSVEDNACIANIRDTLSSPVSLQPGQTVVAERAARRAELAENP